MPKLSITAYCVAALIFCGASVRAQSLYLIDSLKKELETAKGEKQVDVLLDLSKEHWALDSVQANNYARRAYKKAQAIDYPRGLVWGIAYQGVPLEYFGQPQKAQVFYRKGLSIAREYGFDKGVAESLGNIAIAHQMTGQIDSATLYYHQSLKLIDKLNDFYMMSEQLSNLGRMYNAQAQYDSALYYMIEAKKAAQIYGDSASVADCYFTLGHIETRLGRIGNAFQYYFKALKIYKRLKMDGNIASTYDVLGNLYEQQGKQEKAAKHYKQAFDIRERIGDQLNLAISLNNLGLAYLSSEDYDTAIEYLEKGYEKSLITNRQSLAGTFLHNMAYARGMRKQYREALKLYRKSLEISHASNNRSSSANTYLAMANTFLNLYQGENSRNWQDSAIQYYNRALSIAKNTGDKHQIMQASSSLGELYRKLGFYQEATEMMKLQIAMSDSISNGKQQEVAAELNAKYEMRQNAVEMEAMRKEKELNQKKIEQQKTINIGLAFILVLAVTLVAVLYQNNKRTRVANRKLEQQRAEIQQQNEEITIQQDAIARQNQTLALQNENLKMLDDEKNYLIGIVAHDLKSPINQLKGLLGILSIEADKLSDDSRQILKLSNQVLGNTAEMIAKILDLQAIESQTLNLKMEEYDVKSQLTSIVDSFRGVAAEKQIDLRLKVPEEEVHWELDKNLVEQVMENLISNAIKFSPEKKQVNVEAKLVGDQFELAVSDQGPGVHPEEMDKLFKKYQRLSAKPTAGESSTGLGLSIVKKYVVAMRGKVWCESTWGKGASFIIRFNPPLAMP